MCGKAHFPQIPDGILDLVPRSAVFPADTPRLEERIRTPGTSAFVVLDHKNKTERLVSPFSWGFAGTYNARVESADSKGLWKQSFASHRCLVPVFGFFEGKGVGERFITGPNLELLFLAGVWRRSPMRKDLLEFAILTQEANTQLRDIHPRMPCVVDPQNMDPWLNRDLQDPHELRRIAIHAPSYHIQE